MLPAQRIRLYGELAFALRYAHRLYKDYFESGKVFLYALLLYEANSRIKELLQRGCSLIPDEAQTDARELMHHIDVWSARWKDAVKAKDPRITDRFDFDNDVTFPSLSVDRLLKALSH